MRSWSRCLKNWNQKEAERTAEKKAEKVSVKDKLAQMKVKSEQQIQSEKVNTKVKEQAVSI